MPFKMPCPRCGKVLDVPESMAGKLGKCPACASQLRIPSPVGSVQSSVSSVPAQDQCSTTACPGCARRVQISDSMAGKCVKCPACATVWRIPEQYVDVEIVPGPSPATKEWVDDPRTNEYSLGPIPEPAPVPPRLTRPVQSRPSSRDHGAFAPERKGIAKGVMGGFAMMAIAVVWFVAGYAVGIIFYYPPVLFLIGLFALVKGILTGNLAGERE